MSAPYKSLKPLVPWRSAPRPPDWPAIFGRRAPLELELGCGNGELLAARAGRRDHCNLVGLDQDWMSVRRALRKINLAGVDNARVVLCRAETALGRLFPPRALAAAWCAFPRPWPREEDAPNRLLQAGFLRLLASRLADGALFWVASDSAPYLEWVREQSEGGPLEAGQVRVAPPPPTKYGRKWAGQGQREFYRLELTKIRHPRVPAIKEPALKFHWIPGFHAERFQPVTETAPFTVDIKELIYDPVRCKGLLRTVAVEEGIKQAFWIEIGLDPEPDRPHPWRIRLAPGCGVIPTLGVQQALDLARRAALATLD